MVQDTQNKKTKIQKEQSGVLNKGSDGGENHNKTRLLKDSERNAIEVRILEKEKAWAMKDAADALIKWDERMLEHLKRFDMKLVELQDDIFMLRKFPGEVEKKIASITPDIASEVFTILRQNAADELNKEMGAVLAKIVYLEEL